MGMQVSDRVKKRGKTQLGTLGAGNHYVEVQVRVAFIVHVPKCNLIFEQSLLTSRAATLLLLSHCG